MNSKKKILMITTITVLLLGVSFAFFIYQRIGDNSSEIITGQLYLKYQDNNTLMLNNIFPETKAKAMSRTDNVISFSVKGKNTHTTDDVAYSIGITYGDEISGKTRIKPEDIRVYLESEGKVLVDGVTYQEWNDQKIYESVVKANTTTETTTNYTLRVWVDENVLISDSNPNANYTADVWNKSYISLKVVVEGKDVLTLKNAVETNSATYLSNPDTDGTRFITGNTVDNNYLWYSGKLWRIVSINGDGSIKLITQGNMTTIAWNTTSTNTVYENSQIHNWLKKEFLPTLETSVLADSTWDYTTYSSFPTTKLATSSVNEKVGLLNIYEFMKTGGTNSSSTTNTFLNNGYYWWTMSPKTDGSSVWFVNYNGYASNYSPTDSLGVRPSVNLKSDIQIMGGSGTKSNPYVIGGDKATGTTSELLSNRISGEYINFNNVLYRIVGTEEIEGQTLTKITMADYSLNKNTLTTSLASGSGSSQRIFSPTYGIGLYLEEWYQSDSTSETYATTYIKDNYKAMIATATEEKVEWYTGPTSGVGKNSSYTLAKTGTPVSATIGLGYYGEMFSSQFGDGYNSSNYTWLMTIYSSSGVWFVNVNGSTSNVSPAYGHGVRASMYLKSDVKIVSGSGMPHDPYEITQ